jgi:outer membrane immunogenic protein
MLGLVGITTGFAHGVKRREFMNRLLLSGVALIAIAVPALAADLAATGAPRYASPPPPLPPVLTWTGWYIGVNAGGGWGSSAGIGNNVISSFCNTTLGGCMAHEAETALRAAIPPTFDSKLSGFVGGGQFGYNWQSGAWVWGLETDIQGADLHGGSTRSGTSGIVGFPANAITVTGTANQKIDFLGTVRGRIGVTLSPPWLIYATGGLAYGHTKTDVSFTEHVSGPCFCGPDPFSFASDGSWRAGWTAGAGVEWRFAQQWSFKGEWLHYDLGHVTVTNQLMQLNGALVPFFGATIGSHAAFRGDIARFGVNYHFY